MSRNTSKSGFFEELARHCARHPWRVTTIWLMLFAVAAGLYLTIFSQNMTTVTTFTTDTDSKMAEDLFAERFPQAAYDLESCVVTSNTYTAETPEYWAYVDGMWARLQPLRDQGIVKDAQYYDPALREGAPLLPPVLEQIIGTIRMITEGDPTSEQLLQTAADLKSSAAGLRAAANGFADDALTGGGKQARAGMLQAADQIDELSATVLTRDGLQKLYDALLPLSTGEVLTVEAREATVTGLKATAARLGEAAAYLESTGPGSSNRPTLISGLKQFAEQAPLLAATCEAKYAAQLGRNFAVMLTGESLPTAAATSAVVTDMTATGERLTATVAYVEQTVPDSETRQAILAGLSSAATQMRQYGATVLPILARALGYVEDPGSGFWGNAAEAVLRAGLGLAGDYMQDQIETAEAGLRLMQEQTSAQIGTVADGIAMMESQMADGLPAAADGLQQARDGIALSAGLVSTDRMTTQFIIMMSEDKDEAAKHILTLRDAVLTGTGIGLGDDSFEEDGFRVRMVGNSNFGRDMQDVAFNDLKKSLAVAVPIALIVLFVVCGTLGAAMLPVVLGLASIVVALGMAAVIGTWVPMAFAVQNIVAMLGLALGIDHALLVAYRYREERRKGLDKIDAIARAGATAGHAIFYAGLATIIAFFGIFMIPCNMHQSLAIGAVLVLSVIALASITFLPAVLSLIGNGFDFGRLPWQPRLTDPLPPETGEKKRGAWHWLTFPAMKAPVISFIVTAAILAACILPLRDMRMSYSYVDTLPPGCVSKSGYDAMIEAGFPNYAAVPLHIAIDSYNKPAVRARTAAFEDELEAAGFFAGIPISVNDDGTVAWKMITLTQDPFNAEAAEKVRELRDEIIGSTFEDAGGAAYVCGYGGFNNDFVDVTAANMTPVLLFVIGVSLLLLLVAFRSVLLAVVLSLFNMASVYASYALVVFVFQGGHGFGLYKQISGIDAYVPICLLCGLLGISMDYFVFMMARTRERYDESHNMSDSILFAFRRSGLVVLGAAAVMMVVFFAFSISQIVIVSEIGFGMFVSILLDATLITLVMSPAIMKLLGRWFWWWPSWLSWVPDLRARPGRDREAPGEQPGYGPAGVPGYAARDSDESPPRDKWRS